MPEPTTLEHARAVKLRLRAASKDATEARKEWTGLRFLMAKAEHEETRAMHAARQVTVRCEQLTLSVPEIAHHETRHGQQQNERHEAQHHLA